MKHVRYSWVGWLVLAFAVTLRAQASEVTPSILTQSLAAEQASAQVIDTVSWIVDSKDNLGMPFMIIDKREARVFMFDVQAQLQGASSALLGLAVGDDSVPGIGERSLASMLDHERTTPAGRFVASLGRNLKGHEILWVDYETAISLHPVVTGTPRERRGERLASLDAREKRISYGCINVPQEFYATLVSTAFKHSNGVVYVLPETRANHTAFPDYYEVR